MGFRLIVFAGLFLLFPFSSFSQEQNDSVATVIDTTDVDTVPDSALDVPVSFDNTLDHLLRSWVIKHSDSVDCVPNDTTIHIPDSVYISRLSKLPCIMEMPFNKVVRQFIEIYTIKKRKQLQYLLGMSDYYFPIFEQVLGANNMPLELKYIPIIESALNTRVVSRMGAAGLWQLMIATARMYGLEVNSLVDERLNPVKATKAAVSFLKDLYEIYGDWHLVIAAYNCGPGNVNKAIRRSGGKRDYWAIYPYLPRETRGYVPIFIAATYAMNYAAEHNICPATVNMPVITDTVVVHKRISLVQIADVLGMPIQQVRLLNAEYRKDIVPGDIKPYSICLPLRYASAFIDKYKDIVAYKADSLVNNRRAEIALARRMNPYGYGHVIYYRVRPGQTLSHIALRYGVSVSHLKRWNHLKSSRIRIGQRIKILK